MSVALGGDVVDLGHINNRTAFDAVLVAHIKIDVVFNIECPEAFVVL
jgi:hypothetical protein